MLKTESADVASRRQLAAQPTFPSWFRPALFIAVPVSLSFGAWTLVVVSRDFQPASASLEALTGFGAPAEVSTRGVVLLLIWYLSVISMATTGWRLGVDKKPIATVARLADTAAF